MAIPDNDKKNMLKSWPIYLFLLLVLASSLWAIHKRRQALPAQVAPVATSTWGNEEVVSSPLFASPEIETTTHEHEKSAASAESTQSPGYTEQTLTRETTSKKITTLQNIINARQGWDPVGTNWYGREAEDFTFRSIDDDKVRKLSDYRGKDVIVVFWATWCPPCKIEIPHLKKLRKDISPEKLEIIAVSKENTRLLKQFAKSNDLNYTITSVSSRLPAPFSYVESIPTSFYINEQGEIDLIAVGVVPEKAAKSIIAASGK